MGEIAELSMEDDYQCECGEYLTDYDVGLMCPRCRRSPEPAPQIIRDKFRRFLRAKRQGRKNG